MTTTRPPRRFLAAAAAAGIAAALSPWPAPAVPVPAATVSAGPLDAVSALVPSALVPSALVPSALVPSALAPSAPAARIAAASAGRATTAGVPAAPASGRPAASPPAGSAAAVRCVAGRYAAEAGAEVLRVNRLDLGPAGHPGAALGDVGAASALSLAWARSGQVQAGLPSRGTPAQLQQVCATGAWVSSVGSGPTAAVRLSPGDIDEGLFAALSPFAPSEGEQVEIDSFERADAYRTGLLGGLRGCRAG